MNEKINKNKKKIKKINNRQFWINGIASHPTVNLAKSLYKHLKQTDVEAFTDYI